MSELAEYIKKSKNLRSVTVTQDEEPLHLENLDFWPPLKIKAVGGARFVSPNLHGASVRIINCSGIEFENVETYRGMYGLEVDDSSNIKTLDFVVTNVGQEGIVFRPTRTDSVMENIDIVGGMVGKTGLLNPQWGEGIYLGNGAKPRLGVMRKMSVHGVAFEHITNEGLDVKNNVIDLKVSSCDFSKIDLHWNAALTLAVDDISTRFAKFEVMNNLFQQITNKNGYISNAIIVGNGKLTLYDNFFQAYDSNRDVAVHVIKTYQNKDNAEIIHWGNHFKGYTEKRSIKHTEKGSGVFPVIHSIRA